MILAALDVTNEATNGGLCVHMLPGLPMVGAVDDVERLNRDREQWDAYLPDCGNTHHLLGELIAMEKEHRAAASLFAMADSRAKSLKKDVDMKAQKVHELLARIADRKPLPLFEQV